jgi:sodium/pantothenate symporter
MMFAIGTITLIAALVFPPDIFWLTTFPVGIMSIWSKRITESAAFWGMLSGLVFNVGPKFFQFIGMIYLPSYLNPALLGAAASLVVTIVVSRFTSRSEEEVAYLNKLHEIPPEEKSAGKTRLTLLAPAFLVANGVIMSVVLLYYYVRPYQMATDTLSADGSFDWFAGEALFAMSWFFIYVSLGIWAVRVLRDLGGQGLEKGLLAIAARHSRTQGENPRNMTL